LVGVGWAAAVVTASLGGDYNGVFGLRRFGEAIDRRVRSFLGRGGFRLKK
jgi:hypothetical protein